MLLIKFDKSVKVNELVKYLNDDFLSYDNIENDFNKGSGVYSVVVGSRGEIEEICFIGEKNKLMEENDIINEYYDGDCDCLDMVCSGEIDWNDFGGYYECIGEESSIEYYNVDVS